MNFPESIRSEIENELNVSIREITPVYGGDINNAAKITFQNDTQFFIKWNMKSPPNMFESEAKGLKLLSSENTHLVIPEVHLAHPHFLILDWIEEVNGNPDAFAFGKELAKLHKKTDDRFGLSFDNYIGRLPQPNNRHSNWFDFFAIERIEPQIKMGVESGKLARTVLRQVEGLYKNLGRIFPVEKPALLHGDLWSGNYMFTKNDKSSIYDPAVYYGHREMDIAMTQLFGGFPPDFYHGYEDEFPLEPGFETRKPLYNLYPILVHANLFGGTYCRQAEEIIGRFA